jgi:ribonuclease HI
LIPEKIMSRVMQIEPQDASVRKALWADELPPPNAVLGAGDGMGDAPAPVAAYDCEKGKVIIWFDGSANPNPGLGGVGIVVITEGEIIHEESLLLNPGGQPTLLTNNQAEMYGLERALNLAVFLAPKYRGKIIEIRTDSLLVANTYNGVFRPRKLKAEFERCLAVKASDVTVVHIPEVDDRHCGRVDYLAGLATGTYTR